MRTRRRAEVVLGGGRGAPDLTCAYGTCTAYCDPEVGCEGGTCQPIGGLLFIDDDALGLCLLD